MMQIRDERPGDEPAIDAVQVAAFRDHPFSRQTEHLMVRSLRAAGALRLSLVALQEGAIVGHLAFSPVTIDGAPGGWVGLGPLAVQPDWQRRGVGRALVAEGLRRLGEAGVEGCVVLGDPAYYGRLGFGPSGGLRLDGVPPDHFMARRLADDLAWPRGEVRYHAAFG